MNDMRRHRKEWACESSLQVEGGGRCPASWKASRDGQLQGQRLPASHVPLLPAASHLWESQEARYCSVGTSLLLGSSSMFLKVWYWTSSISTTLDLLEMPVLGPYPLSIESEPPGVEPSSLSVQAPRAIVKYANV